MRGLMILVAGSIGAAVGVSGAVLLLGALRAQGGGGPSWEAALLIGFGSLCAAVFALFTGWLTASVDTEHLAVAPTRHLMTLTLTLVGGGAGLGLYVLLTTMAGGPGALAPMASRVFAGALIVLGGGAGLGLGRLVAVRTYY